MCAALLLHPKQAGRYLPLCPMEGAPGYDPGLTGPQPVVRPSHSAPEYLVRLVGVAPIVSRLSTAHSALELEADGPADGDRTRVVLVGNEVPDL